MLTGFKGSKMLKKEIDLWIEEEIITTEQGQKLIDKYDLEQDAPWYLQSSFILRGVAITLVLMGVILVISVNWHIFPVVVQMLIGLLPLLLCYGLVIFYLYQQNRESVELALFAGSFLFGINIFLQAQIFHISAYFPDGFLWWMIGALPVAIYLRSQLLGIVLQVLFISWLNLQIQHYSLSLYTFILLACFLYFTYKTPGWLSVLLHVFTLFMVIVNVILILDNSPENFFNVHLINAFSLFFLGVFSWVSQDYSERFQRLLVNSFTFFVSFLFYLCTFSGILNFLGHIPHYSIYILFVLGISLLLPHFSRLLQNINLLFIVSITFVLLFIGMFLGGRDKSFFSRPNDTEIFFSLLTNIPFLIYCLFKIFYGIQHRRKPQFMSGIFYLVILAISRYMSLVNDYLTTAFIFVACGVGIYFINNLWNQRYATQ